MGIANYVEAGCLDCILCFPPEEGLDTILDAFDVTKHYRMGETLVRALDGISISVGSGEFIGVLGTSGSGKSTLLNLIAGLDRPTSGTLKAFGRDLARMSRQELSLHRRRNVGMVFQSFNLIPTMTALENVALALLFAGVPLREREERAHTLLSSVGLGARQTHRPREMSGGEQQRVAMARALANSPHVLLADEPTGNLDSHTAREILELFAELNARDGKTVVLVTHDAALAARHVSRSVTLLDGRIVEESRSS
jgi:putative ABC transport system ATP-binding protein